MEYNVHYCYLCGQKIVRLYWDEYIYKHSVQTKKKNRQHETVYFCGWNCMRKFEEERMAKRHGKRRHNNNHTEA